ncbi:WD repeat-containing protein 89-like isoform X1 [Ctenocephalides felis]|uniref:WD repeat-containing protein 89-like isoform X1 n=2 Tax=Ctenocephalides felis TaxID=7515 RepID=UPI000E6E194C|nr:WD repeat-containing protein 89-like isoform X1 [Ctenocephalides felis]
MVNDCLEPFDCQHKLFQNLNLNSTHEMEDLNDSKLAYVVATECAVSLSKNYILHLAVKRDGDLTIAAGLSNASCLIYKLNDNGLIQLTSIKGHEEGITELKFDKNDQNLLYTSSLDGTVKQWDLRNTAQSCYTLKGQDSTKTPLLSFDEDISGRLLCAGTEHTDGDAFLLFWDSRSTKLLGGYWESHDDDITQVQFHLYKRNLMMSGSTDGLINVFDISQSNEDDSLQYTYNTMSSVQKLNWFKGKNNSENISCITHTNDLQIWDMENCSRIANFRRSSVTNFTKRIRCDDCYLINTHKTKDSDVMVIVGSNAGNGECLEGLLLGKENLQHAISFPDNKQIICSSFFDEKNELFIMGGETGILSVFKPENSVNLNEKKNTNKVSNKKINKLKPY